MSASAAPLLAPAQCLRLRSQTQIRSCPSRTRAQYHSSLSHRHPFAITHNIDTPSLRSHRQPLLPRYVPHVQRRTAMKGGQAGAARSMMNSQVRLGPREEQHGFDRDKSQGTMAREMIQKGDMPDDAPLFPGTLIMPKFSDLWKQLKKQEEGEIAKVLGRQRRPPAMSLADRLVKLNYKVARQMLSKQFDRIKRHGQDSYGLFWYWRIGLGWPGFGLLKREGWKTMRLQVRKMKSNAEAMYEEMYTALYSNDSAKLKELCCDSTSAQLAARCRAQLNKGISYDWKLVKHLGWQGPKVMSHKATPQQIDDGSGFPMIFRQVVIRMHSRQRLTPKKHGVTTGEMKEVDIFEFLVLQKRFYMGKEGPWKIWGTVQEATSAEEWDETMNPDPLAGADPVQAVGST